MILSHSAWLFTAGALCVSSPPVEASGAEPRPFAAPPPQHHQSPGGAGEGSGGDRRLSHGRTSVEWCSYGPPVTYSTLGSTSFPLSGGEGGTGGEDSTRVVRG